MVKRKSQQINSLNVTVPLVRWKDVTKVEPIELSCTTSLAFSGYLRQPEGHFIHVFIKQPKTSSAPAARALRNEARALLKLRGVYGIPLLYGVTRQPRLALFMSFTPGGVLGDYLRPETPRTYLAGVLRLCYIIREVHAKGVAHKNLYPCHVFVETALRQDSNLVMVSLAAFNKAVLRATHKDKQYDVDSIAAMALEAYDTIPQNHALYKRRGILQAAQRKDLSLRNVENFLARVLYGKKPPQYP